MSSSCFRMMCMCVLSLTCNYNQSCKEKKLQTSVSNFPFFSGIASYMENKPYWIMWVAFHCLQVDRTAARTKNEPRTGNHPLPPSGGTNDSISVSGLFWGRVDSTDTVYDFSLSGMIKSTHKGKEKKEHTDTSFCCWIPFVTQHRLEMKYQMSCVRSPSWRIFIASIAHYTPFITLVLSLLTIPQSMLLFHPIIRSTLCFKRFLRIIWCRILGAKPWSFMQ